MWRDWILTDWTEIQMTAISSVVFYIAIILFTRIAGLRSFSKMSAFDFAMTIALGSLFASTIATPSPSLLLGLVTLSLLFAGQTLIAVIRRSEFMQTLIDNEPILLMVEGQILESNLSRANVTKDDLRAKLREANVLRYDQVKAVVFETTGGISVLHGEPSEEFDPDLLKDVRTAREFFTIDS
ncbi:DUF421 domain-containing protein [Rubinisphaera margarita]|uniref:DUF421 domain-containing protein n=1 Tax=Rubinisphaera margarita TaxID=2909586 RepID=UPI001EE7EEE7|nr:YetF domain-containing protein [Rubinisphaera margarita]MCG6155066.1 DUF421 domain-containing protein [Rubinisphaera margarita]